MPLDIGQCRALLNTELRDGGQVRMRRAPRQVDATYQLRACPARARGRRPWHQAAKSMSHSSQRGVSRAALVEQLRDAVGALAIRYERLANGDQ
jgi:hypothetical protein